MVETGLVKKTVQNRFPVTGRPSLVLTLLEQEEFKVGLKFVFIPYSSITQSRHELIISENDSSIRQI